MEYFIQWLEDQSPLMRGVIGGVIITLLNTIGASFIIIWRSPSRKFLDSALGFAAGVMLTASYTSLIIPGVEAGGVIRVLIGIIFGYIVLDFGDHTLPHMHMFKGMEGMGKNVRLKRVWLLILAITLHNIPEGLAVGVGLGSENIRNAVALMFAIGIQNIPEGFAVAVSALASGKSTRFYSTIVGIRAGLVEIPLAVLGAVLVSFAAPLVPYAMGFAAGAMIYVISDEIIPETHTEAGHERVATFGLLLGVMVMLYLDVVLG